MKESGASSVGPMLSLLRSPLNEHALAVRTVDVIQAVTHAVNMTETAAAPARQYRAGRQRPPRGPKSDRGQKAGNSMNGGAWRCRLRVINRRALGPAAWPQHI
jgi:hypothetical protein